MYVLTTTQRERERYVFIQRNIRAKQRIAEFMWRWADATTKAKAEYWWARAEQARAERKACLQKARAVRVWRVEAAPQVEHQQQQAA